MVVIESYFNFYGVGKGEFMGFENFESNSLYITRQPIFSELLETIYYELQYKTGFAKLSKDDKNFVETDGLTDGDISTLKVFSNVFSNLGIATTTQNKPAFVNFTPNLIINDFWHEFPTDKVIFQLFLKEIPSDELILKCKEMVAQGYRIAVNNLVLKKEYFPILKLSEIIKVDFIINDEEARGKIAPSLIKMGKTIIADKIGSKEEFEEAKKLGFHLFQGFFFSKPEFIESKDLPTNKLIYLSLLKEINSGEMVFSSLEDIIKKDMSLTFRLLKYINSPFFGLRNEITSIKNAISLLGEKEIKKWASIISITSLSDDKPDELTRLALTRAKFCEIISEKIGLKSESQNLFLLGIFSLLDVFVGRPMEELLGDISLEEKIEKALLGENNKYRTVLNIVVSYEKGNWEMFYKLIQDSELENANIPDLYFKALEWTQDSLSI